MPAGDLIYLAAEARPKPDQGEGVVEALISVYEQDFLVARIFGFEVWERFAAGSFADTLKSDGPFPIFRQHGRIGGPGTEWAAAPIGYSTQAKDTKEGPTLTAQLLLEDDPEVRRVWKLMEVGALREWSAGLRVRKSHFETKDQKEIEVIDDVELMEASVVVRGAVPGTETTKLNEARAMRILEVRRTDFFGAIGSHSTTTSTKGWDGPAQKANLPNDGARLRMAHAWVDPDGDPDAKASYKFIHHFVTSAGQVGAASTIACSTGIGVLNGGRGGTTIPDGDRRGVYNHLAKHLRDADLEPPELNESPVDERRLARMFELRAAQRRQSA